MRQYIGVAESQCIFLNLGFKNFKITEAGNKFHK